MKNTEHIENIKQNSKSLSREEMNELTKIMWAGRTPKTESKSDSRANTNSTNRSNREVNSDYESDEIDGPKNGYNFTPEAKAARDKIALNNQGLITMVIRNEVSDTGKLDNEDLISYGNIGLMNAIDRYDPSVGSAFSTFAVYWIRQRIFRGIYEGRDTIRRPEHYYMKLKKIKKTQMEIRAEYKDMSIDELNMMTADALGMSKKEVEDILEQSMQTDSLDRTLVNNGDEYSLADIIADETCNQPENCLDDMMKGEILERFEKSNLSDREKLVIALRFGLYEGRRYTLEEAGSLIGITRERVRQIENKALSKLSSDRGMKALYEEMYKVSDTPEAEAK